MKNNEYTTILKEKLSEMFDRKYVFLTGRATTAIYLALKAMKKVMKVKTGNVVLPDILCPSPANAVLYAGLKPIFCDVNLYDYNMNIDSLSDVITKETRAIIPVHLFGQPAEMDKIEQLAEDNNLFVIEDAAQAIGGEYKGKKLGSFGDVSIFSFGGKIVDGRDGGALLTDSVQIAKSVESEIEKLQHRPSNLNQRYDEYKQYFYKAADIQDTYKRKCLFLAMPYLYEDLYLYKFEEEIAEKIYLELGNLEENTLRRKENAKMYRKKLQHPYIIHPKYKYNGTIYRYSILLKGNYQKKVTRELRERGYDASNLYYVPLHEMYLSNQKEEIFKNARYISRHILNLWVEPQITKEYIDGVCKTILNVLNGGDK